MVGTLKPYHMLKKLFGFIALKGSGTEKLWAQSLVPGCEGSHSCSLLVHVPSSHLVKLSLPNIYCSQTKFQKGNVFTPVCDSVHRGEVYI